jgi:cytochrome c biogenesis protein CcmG/thiol:disulfide interchange protein DsbE
LRSSCTLLASVLLAFALAGQCASDFSLPSLRGDAPVRLAEYRNKIVYIDVWASWCAPCLRSMPELAALREKFRGQPFEVIGLNVDHDVAAARAMLERVGVHYPNAFDRDGAQLRALQFANEEALARVPIGFLLDGKGNVRLTTTGWTSRQSDYLAANIELYLAELRVESDARH